MSKIETTATYTGQNGVAGFLTGNEYEILVCRHENGSILVERKPNTDKSDVTSGTSQCCENDFEFYDSWELPEGGEIDLSSLEPIHVVHGESNHNIFEKNKVKPDIAPAKKATAKKAGKGKGK